LLYGGFPLLYAVLYAVLGFVFGALGTWLYNLFAKWMGGIELELVVDKRK
jgi:hypothetical protein